MKFTCGWLTYGRSLSLIRYKESNQRNTAPDGADMACASRLWGPRVPTRHPAATGLSRASLHAFPKPAMLAMRHTGPDVDFERDEFDPGNVFNPAVKKDRPYRDEREFRLIFWQLHLPNQKISAGPDSILVKVDLNMLIDNIYIDPRLLQSDSMLRDLVREKKLECDIRSTALRIKLG
jgi:hypothetical protein